MWHLCNQKRMEDWKDDARELIKSLLECINRSNYYFVVIFSVVVQLWSPLNFIVPVCSSGYIY
jgi:hypothetical protein